MSIQWSELNAEPEGPVFISYRHSGGRDMADVLAGILRTGGIVPWFDQSDLGGGIIRRRIHEAMEEGISAGVLVVTDGIEKSDFIPQEELPRLLALDTRAKQEGSGPSSDFRLYVLNALSLARQLANSDGDNVDPAAPDKLLLTGRPRPVRLWGQRLDQRMQYDIAHVPTLLRDLLARRLASRHTQLDDRQVSVWIQTRPEPHVDRFARTRMSAMRDLSVRLHQDSLLGIPSELDYRCFQISLPILADAVYASVNPLRTDIAGSALTPKVTIAGGGHPSVWWAVGAALPEARHAPGSVECVDIRFSDTGERLVWREELIASDQVKHEVRQGEPLPRSDRSDARTHDGPSQVAVLLKGTYADLSLLEDLRDSLPRCDQALVCEVTNIADPTSKSHFPAAEGYRLAKQFATILRSLHNDKHYELHVATTLPVPLVLLIARLCNTIPVTFYERATPRGLPSYYVPAITVEAGTPMGPITRVHSQRWMEAVDTGSTTLINLTPHDVTLFDDDVPVRTWPAPGTAEDTTTWVRRNDTVVVAPPLHIDDAEGGIVAPVKTYTPGSLVNVPPIVPGTTYIVSRLSAEASHRSDFVFPADEVRDEGRIIGCRTFGRFAPSPHVASILSLMTRGSGGAAGAGAPCRAPSAPSSEPDHGTSYPQ
ncbi:toll/interleukin-1 receptor domain-containing protein [Tessaracoccus defluvii]|uniref:Toll/interleukin-1 receptor domain-containing protein n=1 Tax=Tessaracoccus defluvii TaxID=1285901 RepID=A0A7H0H2L6_9ACTN|nr:toll/interleukin-1 receptor domain-containing protein [Tessaracoccus defluvii]QNP54782.1 toll/interleukin-1 receptor domain-containing protein [Tessaracoccus defluvii]